MRPKPIDINAARRAGFGLDIDIDSDEDETELSRPLVRSSVLFDAAGDQRPHGDQQRDAFTDMPLAAQSAQTRDDEDVWAELG